jgi:hypothetical protein
LNDIVTSRVHDVQFVLGPPPPPSFRLSIRQPPPTVATADSFSHTRHDKLSCLVCHQTGSRLGLLTFERPRGCMICHHQAPSQSKCTSCHQTSEIAGAKTANAVVTVRGHQPRSRPVAFLHSTHAMKKCIDCHVTPVTMEPSALKATCRDCHEDHHAENRSCATCHGPADPKSAHTSLETSHRQCDACHTASTVSRLTPTRTFCSACHTRKATGHYPQKECTSCHFLTDPGSYKSELTTRR